VHGLEAQYGQEIAFVYLDIDDPQTDEFKRQLGYQYQPHLFLVGGDGTILDQFVGLVDASTLETALQAALQ
jgi:thioredoxin-like negative regulator of GroEL